MGRYLLVFAAIAFQCFAHAQWENKTLIRCLSQTSITDLFATCQTDYMIWIKRVFIGSNRVKIDNFCDRPQVSPDDCRTREVDLTHSASEDCAKYRTCRRYFHYDKCSDDFSGDDYGYMEYSCLPRLASDGNFAQHYEMSSALDQTVFQRVYIQTRGYGKWSSERRNQCSLTVLPDVSLNILIMDLRARVISTVDDCPFELYITDGSPQLHLSTCGQNSWSAVSYVIPSRSTAFTVDIVFNKANRGDTFEREGKFWASIEAYDTSTANETGASFQIKCGFIDLLPRPMTTTTTAATTTTTTTTVATTTVTTTAMPTTTTLPPTTTAAPTTTTPTTTMQTTTMPTTTMSTTTMLTTTSSSSSSSPSTTETIPDSTTISLSTADNPTSISTTKLSSSDAVHEDTTTLTSTVMDADTSQTDKLSTGRAATPSGVTTTTKAVTDSAPTTSATRLYSLIGAVAGSLIFVIIIIIIVIVCRRKRGRKSRSRANHMNSSHPMEKGLEKRLHMNPYNIDNSTYPRSSSSLSSDLDNVYSEIHPSSSQPPPQHRHNEQLPHGASSYFDIPYARSREPSEISGLPTMLDFSSHFDQGHPSNSTKPNANHVNGKPRSATLDIPKDDKHKNKKSKKKEAKKKTNANDFDAPDERAHRVYGATVEAKFKYGNTNKAPHY